MKALPEFVIRRDYGKKTNLHKIDRFLRLSIPMNYTLDALKVADLANMAPGCSPTGIIGLSTLYNMLTLALCSDYRPMLLSFLSEEDAKLFASYPEFRTMVLSSGMLQYGTGKSGKDRDAIKLIVKALLRIGSEIDHRSSNSYSILFVLDKSESRFKTKHKKLVVTVSPTVVYDDNHLGSWFTHGDQVFQQLVRNAWMNYISSNRKFIVYENS